MYLMATRPDITHVVSKISRYMHSPIEIHLLVAKTKKNFGTRKVLRNLGCSKRKERVKSVRLYR